jgi:DNA-binding HxlR family transcriptional regulator
MPSEVDGPDAERCDAPNLLFEACPSRQALDLIVNKWAVLTLYAVGAGISRHGELHRQIEGVTPKMLTQTLRDLERSGLVHRELFDEKPPRVEYTLTDVGRSLLEIVQRLCDWAAPNMAAVAAARAAFDARTQPAAPWVFTTA